MFAPVAVGTIEYVPAGEAEVAEVVSVKVKESPFCAPVADAEKIGFGAPYALLVLAAVTVSVTLPMVRVPLVVTTV